MGKKHSLSKKNDYIDIFEQKSGALRLLGKGAGAEIMIQTIIANEIVVIEPGENDSAMEFFYILDGKIRFNGIDEHKDIFETGDYFQVNYNNEPAQFETLEDVKLLYFTTQPVFHYLSSTIRELVQLATQVEEKDLYTHGHIERVKEYALKIGESLHLSGDSIEALGFAAIFHDLGKVNVPDEILNKPGKLEAEEFKIIQNHSADGAALVMKTYYENLGEIIAQHHERIDGSGYPNNLKGHEIKIEAKIIAVADTYDAMTTDRPYRMGLAPIIAVDELQKLKGIHYDIGVVEAFTEILKKDGIIAKDYSYIK